MTDVSTKAVEYLQSLYNYKQELEQKLAFVHRQIQAVAEATQQFASQNEAHGTDDNVQS